MDVNRSGPMSPRGDIAPDAEEASLGGSAGVEFQSSSSSQSETYAVHNESKDQSVSSLDKFAHTRGKRKRTSREDFAILEGEYQRNPRPDKATRMVIVTRVSLSEKEVQIWFQNRRQMTRRKCRTWQPNEITSIIRSSQGQQTTTPLECNAVLSQEHVSNETSQTSNLEEGLKTLPYASAEESQERETIKTSSTALTCPSSQALGTECGSDIKTSHSQSQSSFEQEEGQSESVSVSQMAVTTNNELSRTSPRVYPDKSTQRPGLKRKSSGVRLSLSFDGKAEVVLGSESPSPPKKLAPGAGRFPRIGSLQRSQSAVDLATNPDAPLGVDVPEWRRSRAPGRSRDARTWEFYCDSDARNALTKSAEHDQKGSAQGVLGLIRSGSNTRKPLTPIKRENLSLQRTKSQSKRDSISHVVSKSKLGRTMSSVGRLQSSVETLHSGDLIKSKKSKLGSEIEIWQDNFGDSDKENQDPENEGFGRLKVRDGTQDSRASFSAVRDAEAVGDKENQASVINHIGGSLEPSKQPRVDDELDAVQNLLSLSQGEWR